MCCLKEDAKPTMVCTADDLLDWKDFPKGLKVLLIDADGVSDMRSRLEGMDYTVSAFGNEDEALSAISSKSECFHVAIVAVNTENSDGILKFLEAAKDLPTLMMSNNHCLSTMMKCIALGAVEFLQKPVSDDKLRNLWQHYVHKAFNAGGKDISAALKPVKESLVSMLHLRLENSKEHERESVKQERFSPVMEQNQDKYPAPTTPDHEGCRDLANLSVDRDSAEMDGECKSVETTCGISLSECSAFSSAEAPEEVAAIKDEHESTGAREQNANKDQDRDLPSNTAEPIKPSTANESCRVKASRRKSKVDWTSDLHKKFVQAVEQLGVDQAIPSRILELMKVEGLTRHNVASHLQKYRMHRRHILPKEPERRWPHPGDPVQQRSFYPTHKPVMAFPSYHANHNLPVHPPWMNPNTYSGTIHSWGSPYYPGWQVPNEAWHWQTYPGMHAEAWGCPVMPPPPVGSIPQFPQSAPDFPSPKEMQNAGNMLWNSCDLQPADEVLDKVVKEAISKPWLPLPLGLKPPSTESVLTELSKQGISRIPPQQPPLQF